MELKIEDSRNQEITLDTLRERKENVLEQIRKDKEKIGNQWNEMTAPVETNTKGEYILKMIDNGLAIYDGLMLGLKLMRRFRGFLPGKRQRR